MLELQTTLVGIKWLLCNMRHAKHRTRYSSKQSNAVKDNYKKATQIDAASLFFRSSNVVDIEDKNTKDKS